jgi:hypothetical protein
MRQPIPEVCYEDVERIVRRDFPVSQFDTVIGILDEYDETKGSHQRFRVEVATLKLAHGNLHALRAQVTAACEDWRDVVSSAEYPEYSRRAGEKLSLTQRNHVVEADWKQYQSWLRGQSGSL